MNSEHVEVLWEIRDTFTKWGEDAADVAALDAAIAALSAPRHKAGDNMEAGAGHVQGSEWVLVPREKLEQVVDGIFSKHHNAEENKDAYDVAYFGAMLKDVEEMLATAPQPPAEAQAQARAERLAEALHKLEDSCEDSDGAQYGTLATSFVRGICKDALRDRDQEVGNG